MILSAYLPSGIFRWHSRVTTLSSWSVRSEENRGPLGAAALFALVAASSCALSSRASANPGSLGTPRTAVELASACVFGSVGPGNQYTWISGWDERQLFRLMVPGTCEGCAATGAVALDAAHWALRFRSACTITARFVVVATAGTPECPLPDTTRVLCPPSLHTLSVATASTDAELAMPIGGCCVSEPAFLWVRIVSRTCPPEGVAWWQVRGCHACTEFYILEEDRFWDFCNDEVAGSQYQLWATGSCCVPTRSMRSTWSQVKTIYR